MYFGDKVIRYNLLKVYLIIFRRDLIVDELFDTNRMHVL